MVNLPAPVFKRVELLYNKGFMPVEISEDLGIGLEDVKRCVKFLRYPYRFRVRSDGWWVYDNTGAWGALNMFQLLMMASYREGDLCPEHIMSLLQCSPVTYSRYVGFIRDGGLAELVSAYEEFHGGVDDDMVCFDPPRFPVRFVRSVPEDVRVAVLDVLSDGPQVFGDVFRVVGGRKGVLVDYMRSLKLLGEVCLGVGRVGLRYVPFWFLPEDRPGFLSGLGVSVRGGGVGVVDLDDVVVDFRCRCVVRSKRDLFRVVPLLLAERGGGLTGREIAEAIVSDCKVMGPLGVSVMRVLGVLRVLRGEGVVRSERVGGVLRWWVVE